MKWNFSLATCSLVLSTFAVAQQPAGPSQPPQSSTVDPNEPEVIAPTADPSSVPPPAPTPVPRPPRKLDLPPDFPVPPPNPAAQVEPAVIREPSQGRPVFVQPDGDFFFVMRLTRQLTGSDVSFSLVHALEPSITVPLQSTTPPSFVNNEFASLILKVPPDTTPGLYDLVVQGKSASHRSRRCVRVVSDFKKKFRFVHLSNMNVGDPTAPDFDEVLPAEINLLAPEFIVATGDFTEWSRALNDPSAWVKVLDYLARFDAPVFVVPGHHDHEDGFNQLVANSPIGTIDYGDYHGILLLDHPGHPVEHDADQLRFIDADLRKNRGRTLNFIVTHSDELGLLDAWRARGSLASFLDQNKVRLLIAGGSSDWDYVESASKLANLPGFQFVRTHQSSTCLRDRATGVSHYRIFDVDGDNVSFVYPDDTADEKLQHSVPSHRLRVFYDRPTDGSSGELIATIQNGLNQPIPGAALWLRVAKSGGRSPQPTITGGRLVRALDCGKYWACQVETDVPDKGAVRVLAGASSGSVPAQLPISVSIEGPSQLSFAERSTPLGLRYFAADSELTLVLKNDTKRPAVAWPIVRLNGTQLRPDPKRAPKIPVTLEPGAIVRVPLVMTLRRVSDGPHLVQVYFMDDPIVRLTTFPVMTTLSSASTIGRATTGG